ncbi:DEAD/DEAH box helicase [Rhodococcus sp. 06-156-3C]|nr:DEAD/DEAH box helicase [Rhodococcus sp. 06-156-4C]OZD21947.1 DEAD/DEAH box helicase [Rhodococcus sp. 06-156-3C]OZD24202.1 DEAD/DEAH box helicase [Rhodococcus sp. 06-156-4a]OZD29325.1 DEAD/DEAH box helicase [Rhodococcus sp. 06-156-3b]OZD29709.1 DEAD/DEAH box helicase [Rhodococcus sp. 06-156-3]OZF59965.1 DEAD/DEAH box helicase [Rhodococcus sp. 06-156-4]
MFSVPPRRRKPASTTARTVGAGKSAAARKFKASSGTTTAKKRTTTRKKPVRKTASPDLPLPDPGERVWVLDVPFEDRALASASGARWYPGPRVFAYYGTDLPDGLASFESMPYSLQRWVEDDANEEWRPEVVHERSLTPRETQLESVRRQLGAMNAGFPYFAQMDSTGLGKTLAVCEAVRQAGSAPDIGTVLVVAPKGALPGWRRTIADTEADLDPADRKRWLLVTYQSTKKLLTVPEDTDLGKRKKTQNKRTISLGELRFDIDVVIADESHALMNIESQQSQILWRYQEAARAVVWMSATPGYQPMHFAYMARAIEQSRAAGPIVGDEEVLGYGVTTKWAEFLIEQGFALKEGKATTGLKTWRWEPEDAAQRTRDIDTIHRWLSGGAVPWSISRPSPPTPREPLGQELTAAQKRLYNSAWVDYRKELGLPLWKSVGGKRVLQKNPSTRAAALRFRQKCSYLRIPSTADQVRAWIRDGNQVFVSMFYRESVAGLAEALRDEGQEVAVVDGSMSSQDQEHEIRRFQTGAARVIISTTTSAINLHSNELLLPERTVSTSAPRVTLIHDPRWTPIEIRQIEGRANRIDKDHEHTTSTCYYGYAEGTVEEEMVLTGIERIADLGSIVGQADLIDPEAFLAARAEAGSASGE